MSLFGFFHKKRKAVYLEEQYSVIFDDIEISCTLPDGKVESVEWSDLKKVILKNTDEGPFVPDIFWVLIGDNGGCVIPQGAVGEPELLERLQKLPGFNNMAVIESSGCSENMDFLCWEKQ